MDDKKVPAESFMGTIAANVDNVELNDADFRQFIRNTLPIVDIAPKSKKLGCLRLIIGVREGDLDTDFLYVDGTPELIENGEVDSIAEQMAMEDGFEEKPLLILDEDDIINVRMTLQKMAENLELEDGENLNFNKMEMFHILNRGRR